MGRIYTAALHIFQYFCTEYIRFEFMKDVEFIYRMGRQISF
jgi:hypothetical protein